MDGDSRRQVALVTGASLGIGAATAVELGRSGLDVAETFGANLVTASRCRALVSDVLARMGRIDVLVNNAGSLVGRRGLLDIDRSFWRQIMGLNLDSVLWVTQATVRHMRRRGSGAVINLGSIAGHHGGGPGAMAYATAKAAITGMTKGLAKELIADGIRVNAVNPGVILTPLHERFSSPDRMRDMVGQIPQGRAGEAQEVASVIAFLAGDGASHIVGESVEVNGGMLMD